MFHLQSVHKTVHMYMVTKPVYTEYPGMHWYQYTCLCWVKVQNSVHLAFLKLVPITEVYCTPFSYT